MRKESPAEAQVRMLTNSRNALLAQETAMKKWGEALEENSAIYPDRRINKYWEKMGKPEPKPA